MFRDIYAAIDEAVTTNIPFWVWLIENPDSPIPMPGKISLYNHDYLHILLGRDRSPEDEAFVVGFTMGNDPQTKWYHVVIFKLFSYLIYPQLYKLNYQQLKIFDLGFAYGRNISFKNIHTINFDNYKYYPLADLRSLFKIHSKDLKLIKNMEKLISY